MSFYEGLLGWQYRQMENTPETSYVMIEADHKLIGGLREVDAPVTPGDKAAAPILYFTVDDLAEKVLKAKSLGGHLVGQIVELGKDRGRYQWVKDREGNLIGLWAAH